MNLRQLEVFQAVMYGGTTKNAARLLRISQPAVSNMIRQFEDQLGFKLFDRISGRLHPTLEAKVLSTNLDRVFASVDALENLVNDLRDSLVDTLKILASPSLGQSVLPPAIAAFVKARPEVKICFDTPPNETIITHLDSHQADFGLTITAVNHPALENRKLREGRLVCVLPKDHPLTRKKFIQPKDFANTTFISYPRFSPIGIIVDDAFREHGEVHHADIEVRYCFSACTLVNAGVGVAVVDEFALFGSSMPNLVTRPFRTNHRVAVTLSYAKANPLSRLAQLFIDDYLWQGTSGGSASPAKHQ
ncbi:MAG: LysR family transcriptional regulator [Proteobacteria bacterium]|nr:LysR family transcriptional regulator [Pseudomonadota bacterium]